MDEKDVMILSALCRDARITLSELAAMLGMSVSSVHKRIRKLESEGVIEKYTVIVNPQKFDCVTAFLLISAEKPEKVTGEIKNIEDVVEVYQSLGNFNIVAKVRSQNLDRVGKVTSRISSLDGVMMLECVVTTKRIKEDVWSPGVV